jgi:hypothetical protein
MQMNEPATQGDRQLMPHLLTRILSYLRRNVIAFVALFFAVGAGGGYAIAAAGNKTIHGCVNNRTRVLYVQKRCHRGQSALVWSKQGPASPTAWAAVQANGFTGAGARGIAVQHASPGTYNVTATPSQCTQVADAPTVTVNTGSPPGAAPPGAFVVAWEAFTSRNKFTVFTGVVTGGSFTPTDEAFNVQVPCS